MIRVGAFSVSACVFYCVLDEATILEVGASVASVKVSVALT